MATDSDFENTTQQVYYKALLRLFALEKSRTYAQRHRDKYVWCCLLTNKQTNKQLQIPEMS